jgi:uncharacterized membrane protein
MNKQYPIVLISLLAMDSAWILGFANNFYKKQLGALMGPTKWWPVIAFYIVYTHAIIKLTDASDVTTAAKRGALLGAASYGAYNFTNMAILKDWTAKMTAIDLAWGTAMTAIVAAIAKNFESKQSLLV